MGAVSGIQSLSRSPCGAFASADSGRVRTRLGRRDLALIKPAERVFEGGVEFI
jgi:hypothetical protein